MEPRLAGRRFANSTCAGRVDLYPPRDLRRMCRIRGQRRCWLGSKRRQSTTVATRVLWHGTVCMHWRWVSTASLDAAVGLCPPTCGQAQTRYVVKAWGPTKCRRQGEKAAEGIEAGNGGFDGPGGPVPGHRPSIPAVASLLIIAPQINSHQWGAHRPLHGHSTHTLESTERRALFLPRVDCAVGRPTLFWS